MIVSPPAVFEGVRRAVKQTLFSVGYYHRRLSHFQFPGAAILCYHGIRNVGDAPVPFNDLHVCADVFEAHCRFISAVCNPISLDDLRAARAGGQPLPARPVMVTFDDGYRSVLDHALPSLQRYGIPAAVFVCSDPVLRSRHFWFDTLCRRAGEEAVLRALTLPYDEWCALRESVSTAAEEHETHRPMTAAELLRLASSPLIEIGGHTLSHPTLARASIDEQYSEILGCRVALQDAVGKPVAGFAYPFGRLGAHYGPETVSIVGNAGFDMAFTTEPSFQSSGGDLFEVPRFLMLDAVDDVELAHRLTHSWLTAANSV
jgi:peptidoglycan/xylan/chitin deacetylase (PgdA/CDA1 family)